MSVSSLSKWFSGRLYEWTGSRCIGIELRCNTEAMYETMREGKERRRKKLFANTC